MSDEDSGNRSGKYGEQICLADTGRRDKGEARRNTGRIPRIFLRKSKERGWCCSPEAEERPYEKILQAFAEECLGKGKCIADGREGRKSLLLSNAIYLSSWEKKMLEIPRIGSREELEFEEGFERMLQGKIAKGMPEKSGK